MTLPTRQCLGLTTTEYWAIRTLSFRVNGYHIGQHRLEPGRRWPYEEHINVPLVIRGSGVPKKQQLDIVTSHTDIAPTILKWTGPQVPNDLGGVAIPTTESSENVVAQS